MSPDDLAEHQRLGHSHFAGGADWPPRNGATGEARKAHVSLPIECDNGDALCELAALGEGVTPSPRFVVAAHLEKGALTQIVCRDGNRRRSG